MPKIDDMFYYGAERDFGFLRIAESLDNCTHLQRCGDCKDCVHYSACERLFSGISERAAHRRLRETDIEYYRGKYLRWMGITI